MTGRIHLPPSGASEAGKTFGPYLVLEEIARGGQGVVMKARHERLGLTVALKMLIQQRPKDLKSFAQEARVLAGLRHPNLLRVSDLGEQNGIAYLAMDYVEGQSLNQRVREGGVPPFPWTCRILAEVADALEHCHQRGLIHRDVKPDNVLIEHDRAVLVDFGLVKRDPEQMTVSADSMLTKTGELKGTPRFMAPEQANATKFGPVTPQTDVYALGATLFTLLTGQDPFQGDSLVSVIAAVLSDPPPDPGKLNPAAPRALCSLAQRAMAKDPAQRPASAAAFAAELRALLETPEAVAVGAGRSSPWVVLFGGLAVLVVVAGALLYTFRREFAESFPPVVPVSVGGGRVDEDPVDRARLAVARGDAQAAALVEALPPGAAKDLLTLERLLPALTAADADRAFELLVGAETIKVDGWSDTAAQRWLRLARALDSAGARAHAARAFVTAAARLSEAQDEQAVAWVGQAFEADAREAAVSGKPIRRTLLRWATATLTGRAPTPAQIRRARAALLWCRLITPLGSLPPSALEALWRLGGSEDRERSKAAQPGLSQWVSERRALAGLLRGPTQTRETSEWKAWMNRGERRRTFDRLLIVEDMILWQPKVVSGWIHLGHASNAVMKLRQSQRAWEIRRELDAANADAAAYDLAVCLDRQGRYREALPYAQEALDALRAKGGRNPWYLMLVGELRAHAGQHVRALEALDAAGGALDKHGRYWRAREIALDALGRRDEASRARAALQRLSSPKGP